ncbi:hypothetical protein EVC03_085 [Rhizobium phage RHph_Y5A]|nr:hypothetical protein EVC03_085 [Rhizobium phage RHph_Y5A]QIG75527.1 hypothetical protein EVC18_085 [Rhizobium phage RHph_Y2_4]
MISIWLNRYRTGKLVRNYVKIHHLPRIGEELLMTDQRYRITDIVHEAVDDVGTWNTHIVVTDLGRPEW